MTQPPPPSPRSRSRKLAFLAVACAIPFLLFAIAELAVRAFVRPRLASDNYVQMVAPQPFLTRTVQNGVPTMVVTHPDQYPDGCPPFPVVKPPGTVRVFCLGGSASAGWPHTCNQRYSEYLRQALQAAYPDRAIEMLNVSAHAYASYRVRLIAQEVLELSPDLLILWCGNNEFLERRHYRTGSALFNLVNAAARKSRLMQLLVEKAMGVFASDG